jgi:hypothetical protein
MDNTAVTNCIARCEKFILRTSHTLGAVHIYSVASDISDEITYVDGGFNTTAMGNIEE